jgi:hypothetical protein
VRGRLWLVLGAVAGIAIAAGHLPYLAGAGRSLANTAERLVGSGANRLIQDASLAGIPGRAVLAAGGLLAALLPGITALLLVLAARATLRLRAVVAVLVVALGAASYLYEPHGEASGTLILALVVAAAAVALSGPLVAAPLAGAAALIGGVFLPTLVTKGRIVTQASVNDIHTAVFGRPGTPGVLVAAVLILAVIPFFFAARLVVRD